MKTERDKMKRIWTETEKEYGQRVDVYCDKCNKQIKSINDDWIVSLKRKVHWCKNCFEEEKHCFQNLEDAEYEQYLDYKKEKEDDEN